jgi:hypothetical protein
MLKKPLGLLGIFLIIVSIGYFVGAGVAYSKVNGGYNSLEAFSEAQNVMLSYDDDGNLVDRGTTEGADAILSLLEDDWDFPVVNSDLSSKDPLVNSATEYMYQMATIVHHTLTGTQHVVLTEADLTDDDGNVATEINCNGETVQVPDPFPEEGVVCDFQVDGRYWTGFDRSDPVQAKARDLAWSGTTHALVAELGVGAVTHSTLQLGLGIAALLAGLGVVTLVMGVAFLWHSRNQAAAEKPAKGDGDGDGFDEAPDEGTTDDAGTTEEADADALR